MSEREHVKRSAISRSGVEGLRRHVHKGPWPLAHGLGKMVGGNVRYSGVAQVCDLGRHGLVDVG